jgi:hypothetical protein
VLALAVALALAGGLIAATAFTGSASPRVWTRQVQAVVSQCKVVHDEGERGVGHCADEGIATAVQTKPATSAPVPTVVRQNPPAAAPTPAAPIASGGPLQAAPPAANEPTGGAASTETQTGGGIGHPPPTPKK